MNDEKDAVSNFLNEANDLGESNLFKEDPVKEIVDNVVEEEDKPIPFHKDPKVQRYVEKEIAKALNGVKPTEVQQFREAVASDVEDVIGAFSTIIGNDTPEKVKALEALKKTLNGAEERAATKAVERFQQQTQAEQQKQIEEDKKAQQELDDYFDEIEETYNVDLSSNSASAKQKRAEFIDFVRKIAPKDENGEVTGFPDLVSSYEEFQERGKRVAPASRAKELASRGMTRSTDASTEAPRGKSWKDVDKLFEKLKNLN